MSRASAHQGDSPTRGEGHCPGPPSLALNQCTQSTEAWGPARAPRSLGPPQPPLAPRPGRPGRAREMTSGPTGNQSQFQVPAQLPLPRELHFRATHSTLYAARSVAEQTAIRPPSNAPAQDLSDEPNFIEILPGSRPGGPIDYLTDSTRSSLTIDHLGVLPLTFLSMGPFGSSSSTPLYLQHMLYPAPPYPLTCRVNSCLTFSTTGDERTDQKVNSLAPGLLHVFSAQENQYIRYLLCTPFFMAIGHSLIRQACYDNLNSLGKSAVNIDSAIHFPLASSPGIIHVFNTQDATFPPQYSQVPHSLGASNAPRQPSGPPTGAEITNKNNNHEHPDCPPGDFHVYYTQEFTCCASPYATSDGLVDMQHTQELMTNLGIWNFLTGDAVPLRKSANYKPSANSCGTPDVSHTHRTTRHHCHAAWAVLSLYSFHNNELQPKHSILLLAGTSNANPSTTEPLAKGSGALVTGFLTRTCHPLMSSRQHDKTHRLQLRCHSTAN